MKEGKPSFTAEGTAALRYAEWLAPEDVRVANDYMARDFVAKKFAVLGRSKVLTKMALKIAEWLVPGMVGYIVGRTKYIDDYLAKRIEEGFDQLVILGAGYDSRAYRFDQLKNKRVFEVDFPSTQRVKMDKVRRVLGRLPDHVTYVGVDFDKKSLKQGLFENGYDKDLQTFFIWEGVTPYLTPEAMDETLGFVSGNSAAGSSIIFDYIFKSAVEKESSIGGVNWILRVYERIAQPFTSERFKFGISQGTIEDFLHQRGFDNVVNISGALFESAYFRGFNRNGSVWATVYATVKPKTDALPPQPSTMHDNPSG